MRDLGKFAIQIPARGGSKRVKSKNLRFIAGKPLIQHTIETAKELGIHDIYVNSDSKEILKLAENTGAKTYLRSEHLASDEATGDEFTYDFIKNMDIDTCLMLSPVCPLIRPDTIRKAIDIYKNGSFDTLISCEEIKMQAFFEDKAVNIDSEKKLQPTQNNKPVKVLNWAITIWDSKKFIKHYDLSGSAYIGRNRFLYTIPNTEALKISIEEDFKIAESILLSKDSTEDIKYWYSNE